MKILLIGGCGFVGVNLARELINQCYKVKIFDKRKIQDINFDNEFITESLILGDIRNKQELNEALNDINVIFHLAAEHRDDVRPVSLYYDVNVRGARNIVNVAEANNIKKIIFTSTVAVYGLNQPNATESSPLQPFNDYSKSKVEAEKIFIEWAQKGKGRSLVIVRPVVIFGEGNKGNVYNLIKQIANNKFIMVGSGRNKKSMAYVRNFVKFLIEVLKLKEGIHIFNYADKPDLSMNELVGIIRRELGKNKDSSIRLPYYIGLAGGYFFDLISIITKRTYPISNIRIKKFCANTTVSTKALELINFKPTYTLEEGLRKMIREISFKA